MAVKKRNSEIIDEDKIYAYTLENAITHDGKAVANSVLGKLFLEGLKKENIKDVMPTIKEMVDNVNGMSLDKQNSEFELLKKLVKERVHEQREELPELQNAKSGKVVMRMAPNPNGPLHIGHARMIILNDEYTKRYKGKLILRFDDTDPKNDNKKPMKEAYKWAEEDLKWLGVKYDGVERASARLDKYYKFFEDLIKEDFAYVCTCEQESWSEMVRIKRKACPCRSLGGEEHLERWQKMLKGKYKEGQAVGRLKTKITEKNPAVIDWPTFRIVDKPDHPFEKKAKVWPVLDFASAYDDHDFGVTHIVRGKDLATSEEKQRLLYDFLKWEYPETVVYGKFVTTEDMIISKSKIAEGIKAGIYSGYDDPRLSLLRAYRKKGIEPQAIRNYINSLGLTQHETTVALELLFNENKKVIDELSNRYFAVFDPKEIELKGYNKKEGVAPLYPDKPEKGHRHIKVVDNKVFVQVEDLKQIKRNEKFRLMWLANFTHGGEYCGFAEEVGPAEKKLQWVSSDGVPISLIMDDGSVRKGLAEYNVLKEKPGNHVQFERVGYAVLEKLTKKEVVAYFTHK